MPTKPAVANQTSSPASLSHPARIIALHALALSGKLTTGPKFTKIGTDLQPTQLYHPAKFRRPASTDAEDILYTKFADMRTNEQTLKTIYRRHAYRHVRIINWSSLLFGWRIRGTWWHAPRLFVSSFQTGSRTASGGCLRLTVKPSSWSTMWDGLRACQWPSTVSWWRPVTAASRSMAYLTADVFVTYNSTATGGTPWWRLRLKRLSASSSAVTLNTRYQTLTETNWRPRKYSSLIENKGHILTSFVCLFVCFVGRP